MEKSGEATPTAGYEYSEYKNHDEQIEGSVKVLSRPARVFTPEEEAKLYRKVDMRIMPILALLYLLSFSKFNFPLSSPPLFFHFLKNTNVPKKEKKPRGRFRFVRTSYLISKFHSLCLCLCVFIRNT